MPVHRVHYAKTSLAIPFSVLIVRVGHAMPTIYLAVISMNGTIARPTPKQATQSVTYRMAGFHVSSRCRAMRDVIACYFFAYTCPPFHFYFQLLAIDGTGNTCSGVEISLHATPNGCGCQPSETEPCTYNPAERSLDDWCYVCNADELVKGNSSGSDPCDVCKACLSNCHSCVEAASSTADMMTCLASDAMNTGNTDPECRENCSNVCTKIQL